MNCRFEKTVRISDSGKRTAEPKQDTAGSAFSLVESMTALAILAIVSSSVFVVIDRCISSAADLRLKMQAFEVARENMEELLCRDTVTEQVSYGISDKYPAVKWESSVKAFEPLSSQFWVKAVCSARYNDSAEQPQQVELESWLTDISQERLRELVEARYKSDQAAGIIETSEQAAEYAGIDLATLEMWQRNGMLTTEEGGYVRSELEMFKEYSGQPPAEVVQQSRETSQQQDGQTDTETGQPPAGESTEELIRGYTREQIEQMSFEEIIRLFFYGEGP